MKKYTFLIIFLIGVFLFPNTLMGYMSCGCTPILTTCSPYCCNDGAYCGPFGDSCTYGCCGSNCDCGINDFLDNYCEGTRENKCYCTSPSSGVCYHASLDGCVDADYWVAGADCENPEINCSICGYDPIGSYFISNNICNYGCISDCTITGWERNSCLEKSLGSCCDCTEDGVFPIIGNCPLQYCGGGEGDCICQGCNLETTGDQILDFVCDLEGDHHLQNGSLTIASNGGIIMFANSTFTFDQGHSINLYGSGGYILMSEENVSIIKNKL